eukprot:6383248-Prymnesium_polylepis.1
MREPIVAHDQIAGIVAINKRLSRLCFTDGRAAGRTNSTQASGHVLDGQYHDPAVRQAAADCVCVSRA